MKGLVSGISLLLITGAIVLLGYGAYYFFQYLYALYVELIPRDQIMLLSLGLAVIAAYLIFNNSRSTRGAAKYDSVLLDAKIQIYLKLLDSLAIGPNGDFANTLDKMRNDLLLLADEAVLDSLNNINDAYGQVGKSEFEQMKMRLIKAMRRDLGQQAGVKLQALDRFYLSPENEPGDLQKPA